MTGKTTLSQTFTQQALPECYQATIGVDYLSRVLERDYNYSINIWDFSGDFQTYTEIRNEFYKELTAIVYLFDLGLKRTFDNLEIYLKEL
jgi:GTPase SAR1 family protein